MAKLSPENLLNFRTSKLHITDIIFRSLVNFGNNVILHEVIEKGLAFEHLVNKFRNNVHELIYIT